MPKIIKRNKFTILFVILAVLIITPRARSWSDASRMAAIQSLVEKHSFIIDESVFIETGDKVFINGHFYSGKPSMPSVMGAIIYFPLFYLGIELDTVNTLAYYLITLLTVKLFWFSGLLAFYASLRFTDINESHRFRSTLALGFASIYFTWSSVFNNNLLAASQLIIGFYFLLKSRYSDAAAGNLFYGGFFISLAGTMDIPTAAFYVGFFFYVLHIPVLRRNFLFYVFPLMFTALPALFINYHISGSLIPAELHKTSHEWPGSPWVEGGAHYGELSGNTLNRGMFLLEYSFNIFLGPKGFLLYNPLLFIALPFLIYQIKYGQKFRKEALVIGLVSLIIVLYYMLFTNNYGGSSYSIRWFVPLLPLLFFFIYPYFKKFDFTRQKIFTILFSVSVFISCIGLINPWSQYPLSRIAVIANLKELYIYLIKIFT